MLKASLGTEQLRSVLRGRSELAQKIRAIEEAHTQEITSVKEELQSARSEHRQEVETIEQRFEEKMGLMELEMQTLRALVNEPKTIKRKKRPRQHCGSCLLF